MGVRAWIYPRCLVACLLPVCAHLFVGGDREVGSNHGGSKHTPTECYLGPTWGAAVG